MTNLDEHALLADALPLWVAWLERAGIDEVTIDVRSLKWFAEVLEEERRIRREAVELVLAPTRGVGNVEREFVLRQVLRRLTGEPMPDRSRAIDQRWSPFGPDAEPISDWKPEAT